MGCDIHSYAERKTDHDYKVIPMLAPFDNRNYSVFAFLAGVRNYSAVTPLSIPRGLPVDAGAEVLSHYERWDCDAHSSSWLSVDELATFDYEATMEDRRCTRNGNGGSTCAIGEGTRQTYRDFLGPQFFKDLEALKASGADRVVFWFDN